MVDLPSLPPGVSTKLRWTTNAFSYPAQFGAPEARVSFAGSERATLTIDLQSMSYEQGVAVAAQFVQGLTRVVTFPVPQHGLEIECGDGTGTGTGNSLSVSVSGTVKPGQLFSLVQGGYRYLHVVVAASGGSLTIYPDLRVEASGATVEFEQPLIEGYLTGNEHGFDTNLSQAVNMGFSIRERA